MNKIIDIHALDSLLDLLRSNKQKIVFTNGCFDLLHRGHIDLLSKAKSLGDVLIVAVNSDQSVRGLKGEKRPVNPLGDRMAMLEALECVDFVISFDESTPYALITRITPEVLVKGGDYDTSEIVGADIVQNGGGTVHSLEFLEGYSSSGLIEKIKSL